MTEVALVDVFDITGGCAVPSGKSVEVCIFKNQTHRLPVCSAVDLCGEEGVLAVEIIPLGQTGTLVKLMEAGYKVAALAKPFGEVNPLQYPQLLMVKCRETDIQHEPDLLQLAA
ncbi:MAG: hypothetical protein H6855_04855 [Rhodospirillales bacterium]|nr:hypothetical protein [Rhodospirillales bacterium]MCB9965393.1 hypothetical protein [Rhodospirillales bacterium]MCB9973288.1 hypothetical protein [Rhodospirillales bacterium]